LAFPLATDLDVAVVRWWLFPLTVSAVLAIRGAVFAWFHL
jgi:hypothetical protein